MAGGRPEIIQGSDRILKLTMRDQNGDGLDISNETEITACFKKPDGTYLEVTMLGGQIVKTDVNLGKIDITLFDTDTTEIEAGIKVDFKILLDVDPHPGGTRRIVRFDQQIDVLDGTC